MRDYTAFKQGFIFCAMIIVAVCAVSYFGGCIDAPTVSGEKTDFSPPTSQPSVTPDVTAARGDAKGLEGDVNDAGAMVGNLSPTNLPSTKPPLQNKMKSIGDKTKKLGDDLDVATEKAHENDAAGAAIAKERDDARALVISTEEKAAAQKAQDDKALAASNKDRDRMVLFFNFGVIAFGGLIGIIGGVLAVEGKGSFGLFMLGAGIVIIGGGYAGIYFGWQIGLCTLIAAAVVLVAGVWLAIRSIKTDGQTTIQAVQQAKIAGVIPTEAWPVLKQMFDSIQTPGAKAMVAAETK